MAGVGVGEARENNLIIFFQIYFGLIHNYCSQAAVTLAYKVCRSCSFHVCKMSKRIYWKEPSVLQEFMQMLRVVILLLIIIVIEE